MEDPDGKFAESVEQNTQRQKEARAKRLDIPKDVQPGSAEMVWYRLRNTIITNAEAAEKAYKEGTTNKRLEGLIKMQKMQKTLFDMAEREFGESLIKKGIDSGTRMTAEQATERTKNLTANELYDVVQESIIDHYESLQDAGEENVSLTEGHFHNNYLIQDLLKAARELQSLLIDEGSLGEKN